MLTALASAKVFRSSKSFSSFSTGASKNLLLFAPHRRRCARLVLRMFVSGDMKRPVNDQSLYFLTHGDLQTLCVSLRDFRADVDVADNRTSLLCSPHSKGDDVSRS